MKEDGAARIIRKLEGRLQRSRQELDILERLVKAQNDYVRFLREERERIKTDLLCEDCRNRRESQERNNKEVSS